MACKWMRWVASGVAFCILLATGFSSASASAAETEGVAPAGAEQTAQVVVDAAPADSTVASAARVRADGVDGVGGSALEAGVAMLPVEGDRAIAIKHAAVTIGLPDELPVDSAEVTEDGMVVYQGAADSDGAVAVASTSHSVALQVVLADADAPPRYTFDIGGATPVLAEDGSVELLDANGTLVGFAGAPWATDANGQSVATHYEVDGLSLVQVVDPRGAAFPVVADPEGSKVRYLKSKLGNIASEMSGLGDLVSGCTP